MNLAARRQRERVRDPPTPPEARVVSVETLPEEAEVIKVHRPEEAEEAEIIEIDGKKVEDPQKPGVFAPVFAQRLAKGSPPPEGQTAEPVLLPRTRTFVGLPTYEARNPTFYDANSPGAPPWAFPTPHPTAQDVTQTLPDGEASAAVAPAGDFDRLLVRLASAPQGSRTLAGAHRVGSQQPYELETRSPEDIRERLAARARTSSIDPTSILNIQRDAEQAGDQLAARASSAALAARLEALRRGGTRHIFSRKRKSKKQISRKQKLKKQTSRKRKLKKRISRKRCI